MSNLLSAINDTYGPIILDELLKRIESTILEFNEEVSQAFTQLKNIDKKRQKLYKKIDSVDDDLNDTNSKSEWERKLEEIDKK